MFVLGLLTLSGLASFSTVYLLMKVGFSSKGDIAKQNRKVAVVPFFVGLIIQLIILAINNLFYEIFVLGFCTVCVVAIVLYLNSVISHLNFPHTSKLERAK